MLARLARRGPAKGAREPHSNFQGTLCDTTTDSNPDSGKAVDF